jgi:hypothetical protein
MSDTWTWNPQHVPYDQDYIDKFYRHVEEETGRRFRLSDVTSNRPGGSYKWKGKPPPGKRYWGYAQETMEKFETAGRLVYSKSGVPSYKRYLDEMPGQLLQDVWTDIKPLHSLAAERLGYPTQKPSLLLERIIAASSNAGQTVLDPFCGCGTTIAAAQALGRSWIGIDITHLAINLIKHRLRDSYGTEIDDDYEVIGEPVTIEGAEKLAADDPYQFQWWALGLVGARPTEGKKGADRGIDGRLYFHDESEKGQTKQIIFSVKAGKTGVSHVRDLRGVLEREKAEIGVLLTMQEPTPPMRKEAASAGFYESAWGKHPRIQIFTVGELLDGASVDYPPSRHVDRTFKRAPRHRRAADTQLEFGSERG